MFWDNFERLCREQNMSPNAVAAKLGISSGSLTAWKNGRVPRGATLEKLEQYFDVTKAMLFADNEPCSNTMFKEKFIKLCNQRGVAPTVVCQSIGLSRSAFSNWTDDSVPRRATLQKFADYFGITVDELLSDDTNTKKPSPKNEEGKTFPDIFYQYYDLPEALQREIAAFVEFKISQYKKQKEQERIKSLAEKAAEESKQHELKEAIDRINKKIVKGEFDPLKGQIAAYDGGSTSLERKQAEWVAEIKRLARLIEDEQSGNGDK